MEGHITSEGGKIKGRQKGGLSSSTLQFNKKNEHLPPLFLTKKDRAHKNVHT